MKWFASVLASVLARFSRSSSKDSGSQSIQIKMVEPDQPTPVPILRRDRTISFTVNESKPKSEIMFSDLEEEFIEGYFNQTDMDMSVDDFQVAMKSLLEAKVLQEVEVNGKTYYKLTSVGKAIYKHRNHSNPKDQN